MEKPRGIKITNIDKQKQCDIHVVSSRFFEYGSMRNSHPRKIHISDEDGNVLCGVKSFWMQQYNEIPKSGFIHANYGIGNIKDFDCVCKKCLKKWQSLNGY